MCPNVSAGSAIAGLAAPPTHSLRMLAILESRPAPIAMAAGLNFRRSPEVSELSLATLVGRAPREPRPQRRPVQAPLERPPVPAPMRVDAAGELELLLDAMKLGDEAALRRLHRACSERVRAHAMKFARSEYRAEEAVSSCFAQAWRDAWLYDPSRGSAIAWLLTIVRSRAIDAFRAETARARLEVAIDDERLHQLAADDECGPLATLERARRDAALGTMLASLPGAERQALWLAFGLGLSYTEVASRAQLPIGTVKSHIRRGMRALRAHCEAAGLET